MIFDIYFFFDIVFIIIVRFGYFNINGNMLGNLYFRYFIIFNEDVMRFIFFYIYNLI